MYAYSFKFIVLDSRIGCHFLKGTMPTLLWHTWHACIAMAHLWYNNLDASMACGAITWTTFLTRLCSTEVGKLCQFVGQTTVST